MPPNDYPHWIVNETGGAGHNDTSSLWDTYLEPKCVQALGEENAWHCGSIHNLYPYIETPIFVIENKFDKYQIENSMLMPTDVVNNETKGYVGYYGVDMDRSIITQLVDENNGKNGLFYPSCFDHTGGIKIGLPAKASTVIDGHTPTEYVGDWYWERNKLPTLVYDTCNNDENELPCNPSCTSYP